MEYTVNELFCENEGQKIYGKMYMPRENKEKYPLVICSTGFNSNCDIQDEYGKQFAQRGICAYLFDFRGGSTVSRSEGSCLDMSLLTEISDLDKIYNTMIKLDYIDTEKVFMLGASQGGAVTAVEAAKLGDKLRGVMLVYPGFMLPEKFRRMYPDDAAIPESEFHFTMDVGRRYFADGKTIDMWNTIGNYKGDVYIVHGDADAVVPLEDSYKALEIYENAELTVLPGLGHGFHDEGLRTCAELMTEFAKDRV